MTGSVLVEIHDHVAHVRLNRPHKLNALDGSMFTGLVDAATRIAADRSVRAVVLSANGAGFCAGLDATLFERIGRGEGLGDDGPAGAHPLVERTHGLSKYALAVDADAATLLVAEAREQQALIGGPDRLEILRAHAGERVPRFGEPVPSSRS